ncbi:toll/interleukin-1 receptor domain-containing protein [Hoylesella nanceiensis]
MKINNKLNEGSDTILSYFRKCKVGEGLCLLRTMRAQGLADAYYDDAVEVLLFNGFIEKMHNGGFFKLRQKGFNYLQGGEPLMLFAPPFSQLLYFENIKSKDSDSIFDKLWNLIGTEDEALFYIDEPTYYNVIKDYIQDSYPTYSDFIKHLRSSNKSASRIEWYRELFKKIEGEDILLFLNKLSDAVNQKIKSETGDKSSFFNNTLQQTSKDSLNPSIIKDSSNKGVTVFISYAWDENQEQVRQIATKLQEAGIEVRIDQKVSYGADIVNFMNKEIRNCDKCLVFLTPNYKDKAELTTGGVAHEGRIISKEIYKDQDTTKFIPVLLSGNFNSSTPSFLSGRKGFNFVEHAFDSEINLMIEELKKMK